ncbi:MAG: filamentous hemagglutinin N-terminal domain-containing protein, partial [Gammaproteobacteria bacterium]
MAIVFTCRGRKVRALLPLAFLLTLASTPALSNPDLPTGATVAAGQVTFSPKGSSLDIHQGSHKAIVNWQSFNIGKDASVNIHQPGADAALLNRVLSSDPSKILGSLNANGQVFLINPSGVIFGQGARVDVGGLVASSLNISDKDFLSGSYTFSGNTGSILNQGALQGGFIALISPEIKNEGEIRASLSAIALASGDQAVLTFEGSNLIGLKVTDATLKSLIDNKGALIAPHGAVLLKASAAQALVDNLIQSPSGAGGLVLKNGTVQLVKADGRINAHTIEIDAGPRGGALISG